MSNILDAFYNGELRPWELPPPATQKYKDDIVECNKLKEKLEEQLTHEQQELLEQYVNLALLVSSHLIEQQFNDGLVVGTMFMNELHERKEKLLKFRDL